MPQITAPPLINHQPVLHVTDNTRIMEK